MDLVQHALLALCSLCDDGLAVFSGIVGHLEVSLAIADQQFAPLGQVSRVAIAVGNYVGSGYARTTFLDTAPEQVPAS